MRYLSLFSGIGGFELGISRVFPDATCVGYCEINPNCRRIYHEHFPTHPLLGEDGDVRNVDFTKFRGKVDLVVAGFPCQDLSTINRKRKGLKGEKSSMLIHVLRCLQELDYAPYFLVENVASMKGMDRDAISDLL